MAHRVVITGIGPVTNAGIGKELFFKNIWQNRLSPQPVPTHFSNTAYTFRTKWYLPLPEFSLSAYKIIAMHESLMQPEDRMAVLGAKLALEDAGFTLVALDGGRMTLSNESAEASILLGTGLGGLQTALDSHLAHCLPREFLQSAGMRRLPMFARMVVPKTMPNSPAAWISICFGLTGPCNTVNASCASGTYAIGEAFRRVKDGYSQIVITGGVESLQDCTGTILRGFDVLGVLTQSPDGRPTPFGTKRSGFLFSEGGACVLVLEELEHALARRAAIYAEIADYRSNSDACNIVQIDPEGKQIIQLLGQLSAGQQIDYLNAHGTGTIPNDEIESRAIKNVFGDRQSQPWINSTKGIMGHTLGASGAIEAAVVALSISRQTLHGNLTHDPLDNLNLPIDTVNTRINTALSVSYGFGGHNGGLLLKHYES